MKNKSLCDSCKNECENKNKLNIISFQENEEVQEEQTVFVIECNNYKRVKK